MTPARTVYRWCNAQSERTLAEPVARTQIPTGPQPVGVGAAQPQPPAPSPSP